MTVLDLPGPAPAAAETAAAARAIGATKTYGKGNGAVVAPVPRPARMQRSARLCWPAIEARHPGTDWSVRREQCA